MRLPNQVSLIPSDAAPLPVAFRLSPGAVFGAKRKGLPRHYLPLAPHVEALAASSALEVKMRAIFALTDPVVLEYVRYLAREKAAGTAIETVDVDALITVNQALDIFGDGAHQLAHHGVPLHGVLSYARDVYREEGCLEQLLENEEENDDP